MTATGDSAHWLASGVSFALDERLTGTGGISRRSESFVLTETLKTANRGRDGVGLFDLVDDPAEQQRRYGRQLIAPGEAPADLEPWEPGSVEEARAADQARRIAQSLPDDAERAAALAEVRAKFKISNPSGQRSSYSPGDAERREYLKREGLAV
jgi:hypothetical protein